MTIKLREAGYIDREDIWDWYIDPISRQMSGKTESVNWDTFKIWFDNVIESEVHFMFIGIREGKEKIGLSRFDILEKNRLVRVSLTLNPTYRGRGLSSKFLKSSINKFRNFMDSDLTATIRKENKPSIKCFERVGFYFYKSNHSFNYYRKKSSRNSIST